MEIKEIATVCFTDHSTGDQAVAIVRVTKGQVALCISLEHNGDAEIVLGLDDAKKLLEALRQAVPIAEG